jgi:hypothetical protein
VTYPNGAGGVESDAGYLQLANREIAFNPQIATRQSPTIHESQIAKIIE